MPRKNLPALDAVEHQIFWMLVKKAARRDDVARAYLAVQAALAYRQETAEIGWLVGAMMPEGQAVSNPDGEAIGATGLAYFQWLYEVELLAAGDADQHQYRFTRRADGAQTVALLRTSAAPKSLQFRQGYDRQLRKLEAKRAVFLASFRKAKSAHHLA